MPLLRKNKKARVQVEWLTLRWWQRVLMTLFWPMMFVGTLYVVLFLFLNSTPFARIVEAQLDAATMGDWVIGEVSVDATLTTLEVADAELYTPEGQRVVRAEGIVAPIPWSSLWELVQSTHLELKDVSVEHAVVLLDFDNDGPFNLLRALESPTPPSDEPSTFSLALRDADVHQAEVQLVFQGFGIDLEEVEVIDYNLQVGAELQMQSRPNPGGPPGVSVGRGSIHFDPAMFTFPLGEHGPPDVGIAGDGGAGRLGQAARMVTLAATAMHNTCVRAADHDPALPCGNLEPAQTRGPLTVHFADAAIRSFWWRRSTFGFTSFRTDLLGPGAETNQWEKVGHIALDQPWMNVAPTAEEIAEAAGELGHDMPETRPEDTIIYQASGDIQIPANFPALAWFTGPLLSNDDTVHITAEVSGDLGHAEGVVSLVAERLVAAGLEVADVRFSGALDGQRLEVLDLVADVLGGKVEALGHYMIVDGDFDLDVELGTPEFDVDAGDESVRRGSGIDAGSAVTGDLARYLGGVMTGALKLTSSGHQMAVRLEEPLELQLAEPLPITGATRVVLEQRGDGDAPLVTLENGIVRTHDRLDLQVGSDKLVVGPNLTFWIDALEVANLDVALDVGNIRAYLDDFGIDASSDKLSVKLRADGPILSPKLSTRVTIKNGRYADLVTAPSITLDARYERGRIAVRSLDAKTSLGTVTASGWVQAFGRDLTTIRSEMPLSLDLTARDVRLQDLPGLGELGLRGDVTVENARIGGTSAAPTIAGHIEARDLEGYGESLPELSTDVSWTGSALAVRNFSARYGPREREGVAGGPTTLDIGLASYDLGSGNWELEGLELRNLYPHEIGVVNDAAADLFAKVTLVGSGSGDLDALFGRRSTRETTLNATLMVENVSWAGRKIGSLAVKVASAPDNVIELGGSLDLVNAQKAMTLTARADLTVPSVWGELRFGEEKLLELLELVPELAIALNGDATVHRSNFRTQSALVRALQVAGRVEATWTPDDGVLADLRLSKFATIINDESIVSRGETWLRFDQKKSRASVERMEIANRDKSLMIHGWARLDGTVELDVTGELSATLAHIAGETVAEAAGSLAVALEARGEIFDSNGEVALDGLDLRGFLAVRDRIELRIRGLADPIVVERGVLEIADAVACNSKTNCYRIPLDKAFTGEVLGGSFQVSGEVGRRDVFVPVSAEILATAEALSFRIKDMLTVTFDVPELRLFVLDLTDLELVPPQLYGAIEITDGRYFKDHLVQSEIFEQTLDGLSKSDRREERFETPIWQRLPELAAVELDITIDSESGFRIDNEVAGAQVDLELEFSNLQLGGTLQNLEPSGVVSIRDGSVLFRQVRFEVLPGAQLTFPSNLDAVIDVAAQAEINTQSGFANSITGGTARDRRSISTTELASGSELYIVTLSLTGALSELTWTLESNPFLNQNETIFLVLTGQLPEGTGADTDGAGGGAFGVAFQQIIAPLFESQVDEILSAEQFKFQFAEGAAQFSYIQQVNRALRVAAGVSIRGSDGNESAIAGEYRFSDSLLLELIAQDAVEEEGKAPQFSLGGRLKWRIPLD